MGKLIEILQCIEPLLVERIQFFQGFVELGNLYIDIFELVVKYFVGSCVAQLHMMADFLLVECILVHAEVEQGNGIDMIELEIPLIPLGRLFSDREGGVEEGAILEIRLVRILHFYNELLAVFALTIYIKDGSAVGIDISHMLRVQIRYVLHNLFAIKQAVEEANEQILVHCCSKNSLETEVGQQADVSFFYLLHNHLFKKSMPQRATLVKRMIKPFLPTYHAELQLSLIQLC